MVDLDLVLLILACSIAGALGGAVRTWALARRLYSLEYDVDDLRGITTREVKRRAGEAGQAARGSQKYSLEDLQAIAAAGQSTKPSPALNRVDLVRSFRGGAVPTGK